MYLGTLPIEQKVRWRIDRVSGSSYKRTWVGTERQLKLIARAEQAFAESIEFDPGDGDLCTLVASYANKTGPEDPEVAKETQELDTDAVQQSTYFAKKFAPLTPREQLLIRKAFENEETYETAKTLFQAPIVVVPGSGGAAPTTEGGIHPARLGLALRLYDLLIMGAESFDNYAFTLTRTRTVSRRYPGTLNLEFINTLWTTEQLVAYTGNPTLFEVPTLVLSAEEIEKELFGGWRMKSCRVTDVADGSRQMIEQWQLAKWSRNLYDLKP